MDLLNAVEALLNKSREDLVDLRKNRVGGWLTLPCKKGRKLPQYFRRPESVALQATLCLRIQYFCLPPSCASPCAKTPGALCSLLAVASHHNHFSHFYATA